MAEVKKLINSDSKPYRFDCFRAPTYRTIPADGTWVTVNNFGKFIVTFYTDAPPLPKTITAFTSADGSKFLTEETSQITPVSDAGALRQYEIAAIVSLEAAKLLHQTLGDIISTIEKPKTK